MENTLKDLYRIIDQCREIFSPNLFHLGIDQKTFEVYGRNEKDSIEKYDTKIQIPEHKDVWLAKVLGDNGEMTNPFLRLLFLDNPEPCNVFNVTFNTQKWGKR